MKRFFAGALVLLLSCVANATQKISVDDGKTYRINVATKEASRIVVEKGRIVKAWSMNTNWQVKEDKEKGEIYIRPADAGGTKAFSFFVQDSFGNTYTLVALPRDTPSETVILQPTRRVNPNKSSNANEPYVMRGKSMMKDMVAGRDDSYAVTSLHELVPLWAETEIHLVRRYELNELVGEVYQVRNVSGAPMTFAEQEFANFGQGVIAVAMERTEIVAGDSSLLYVIRSTEGEAR